MALSARNQLKGTVKSVKEGVITAEVVVGLPGGEEIVSVITVDSVHRLGIKEGMPITAIIKATEVLLSTER